MGRPLYSDEQVEEGRRRLAEAALKLYRDEGYAAVTLRGLGAEVGISSATPYRFFASKEALFERVRADVYESFGAHLRKAGAGRGDALARLRRVARAMIDFGLQNPDDYRLLFSMRQPAVAADSPLAIARRRTLDDVMPLCEELIATGRMSGDARQQLSVAWAAIHGLVSFHVSGMLAQGCECDIEDLATPMLDRLFGAAQRRPANRRRTQAAA